LTKSSVSSATVWASPASRVKAASNTPRSHNAKSERPFLAVVWFGSPHGPHKAVEEDRALYDDQSQATRISDFYTSPFPIPLPALDQLEKDSRRITHHLATLRVREIMTTDPLTVAPTDHVEVVAHMMVSERVHRVPVVEEGELVGIVSSLDIVGCVARHGLGTGS